MRAEVRKKKAEGADLVKIFASASIRDGGVPTLSQEQVDAACGEARTQGLRSMVHAHSPESMMRAARAGCTVVEHGGLATPEALKMLADRGVYFDPNIGLVTQNYLENKPRFLGIGNYTEEGFASMEKALGMKDAMFTAALKTPSLKMVMGTDAVAGAHGQNMREVLRAREVRPEADGRDHVAHLGRRRRRSAWRSRSARLRPPWPPTSSPWRAIRSPTSTRCGASRSS